MWLDIFLEYALCLARRGSIEGAYETITTATDASVFYHDRHFMYSIHVCWFSMRKCFSYVGRARLILIQRAHYIPMTRRLFAISLAGS